VTTTARPMLVRAGPGASAWTGLPERDRTLLLWLIQGDVVTAELAALVAYGHRRVAQRRLARLVEYGLLSGFWAANRQRPRGRHAYALTKVSRAQLERLVWPLGKPKLSEGAIETVSPVIHQLATHDLFAAFLRAADPEREIGLAGWVPERALVRLTDSGYLRADALAIVRNRDAMIVLFIERDLGTERGSVLVDKLRRYRNMYWSVKETNVLHVGIVVESQRRAYAVRRALRSSEAERSPTLYTTMPRRFERSTLAEQAETRRPHSEASRRTYFSPTRSGPARGHLRRNRPRPIGGVGSELSGQPSAPHRPYRDPRGSSPARRTMRMGRLGPSGWDVRWIQAYLRASRAGIRLMKLLLDATLCFGLHGVPALPWFVDEAHALSEREAEALDRLESSHYWLRRLIVEMPAQGSASTDWRIRAVSCRGIRRSRIQPRTRCRLPRSGRGPAS